MQTDKVVRYRAIPVIVYARVHNLQTREDHVEEVMWSLRGVPGLAVFKADDFRDVVLTLDEHWDPNTAMPTAISDVCPSLDRKMSLHEKLSNTMTAIMICILIFLLLSFIEVFQQLSK